MGGMVPPPCHKVTIYIWKNTVYSVHSLPLKDTFLSLQDSGGGGKWIHTQALYVTLHLLIWFW